MVAWRCSQGSSFPVAFWDSSPTVQNIEPFSFLFGINTWNKKQVCTGQANNSFSSCVASPGLGMLGSSFLGRCLSCSGEQLVLRGYWVPGDVWQSLSQPSIFFFSSSPENPLNQVSVAASVEGGSCGIITGFAFGVRTSAVHPSAPTSSPGEDSEPSAGTGYFGVTAAA